jgi:sugar O-acyltransferase (sialic acid O-acetyltransferase NeuD family)
MKGKLLVFGSSGHASVVVEAIEKRGEYEIVGLVDSFQPFGSEVLGYRILGDENSMSDIVTRYDTRTIAVAVGDNWGRAAVVSKLQGMSLELSFPPIVHPSAEIARSATLGAGSVVLAGAVVNTRAVVGRWSLLNTNSSLDHDCVMGDFSSLAPNSAIGGQSRIGEYSAISLGASIIHKIVIGHHTVIGAGAVVIRDVPDHVLAFGCPAKVIRRREAGEAYL